MSFVFDLFFFDWICFLHKENNNYSSLLGENVPVMFKNEDRSAIVKDLVVLNCNVGKFIKIPF